MRYPNLRGRDLRVHGAIRGECIKNVLNLLSKAVAVSLIMTLALFGNAIRASAQAVQITAPSDGQTVSGTVNIAAQMDNSVVWVNFYVDSQYLASSPPSQYSWDSTTVPDGSHKLSVIGYDSNHNQLGSQSVTVNVANSGGGSNTTPLSNAAPSGGGSGPSYFSTLPPGASLPSASQCASWVKSVPSSELQPANATANQTTPTADELSSFHSDPTFVNDMPVADFQNIDGNFTGTTDQIIRWASCKWGLDENAMRAEAWEETTPPDMAWAQSQTGDWRTDQSECEAGAWNGWTGDGCWQSYGIYQAKPITWNVWPEIRDSTAFNADFRGGYLRACMNGDERGLSSDYPGSGDTDYRFWGCMGQWYSGNWYDSGAQRYISLVQQWVSSKPWLSQ